MPTAPKVFRFPNRDAVILGYDETSNEYEMDDDDKASALDQNQVAVEDYLSNDLPTIYIQQNSIGGGTIDPAQLATGTPTTGYAPVYDGTNAAWTDVATQSELNAHAVTTNSIHGSVFQRGTVLAVLNGLDTNTSTTVLFRTVFAATPVVTLGLFNSAGQNLAVEMTAATSAQFVARVFPTGGTALGTTSVTVHWFAANAV